MVCEVLKGTVWGFGSKGASEREKLLDTDNFNLVKLKIIFVYLAIFLIVVFIGSFLTPLIFG